MAEAWGRWALCSLGLLLPRRPAVGSPSLPGWERPTPVPHDQGGRAPPHPHQEPGNKGARVGCLGKDGGPLHATSPGKSPPLSLSFPKACPSRPGRLLAGAPQLFPGVQASRAQMESRGHRSLHMAGSCQAGRPSKGHGSLEPATSLIEKSFEAAWAGQELACQALPAPFHHWASRRPTMCWALCQALAWGVGRRPQF